MPPQPARTVAPNEAKSTLGEIAASTFRRPTRAPDARASEGVEVVLQTLLPLLLPEVADVLASFPLPAFLGLQLQSVEVGANGEFISIFTDLVAGL